MKKWMIAVMTVLLVCTMFFMPHPGSEVMAFTEEEQQWLKEAQSALGDILETKDVTAVVYLTEEYLMRTGPDWDSDIVLRVPSGQSVWIQNMELAPDYKVWMQVELCFRDQIYTGYIQREYLACADEVFLGWEADYGLKTDELEKFASEDGQPQVPADIEQFPESYRESLMALKQAHPNWIFVKMDTGLEWDYVVKEELLGGRSLVPTSLGKHLGEGKFSKGWDYATKEALEYYLDPRNGLTEQGVFQFEQLTFNESYHTDCAVAVQEFLNSTFMRGLVPQTNMTYAFVIWAVGKEENISPFHLASRIYQEQGQGTSPLISGTYPGFEGYYNYFNFKASGKTDKEVIENGLAYAKAQNWNTPYLAIHLGARVLGANYIKKGQDTLYLQKFDVDASANGMFSHQYMQNICAPSSEAKSIKKLYEKAGALDNIFVFKIPVYNNMPEGKAAMPEYSKRVILEALDGYQDGTIYLDGVGYAAEKRNGYYVAQSPDFQAKIATMYAYNGSGVPEGMAVWSLNSDGRSYSATAIPELRDLLTYHGFSIRITGKSGIRFKSGIATDVKNALIQGGLVGYFLKEYGNLVMVDANRAIYPMVKNGEKVVAGVSYGMDKNGNPVDSVYEVVGGRQRFTSVLVGLPSNQYKTDYAFRGYVELEKDGQRIIIYGPIMHRSIYQLANQALSMNLYAEGSTAQLFLKQLIYDGDNPPQNSVSSGDAQ